MADYDSVVALCRWLIRTVQLQRVDIADYDSAVAVCRWLITTVQLQCVDG